MKRNNYVLVVFDSCRYDAFVKAAPKTMRKLGRVERRWAYASWTAPSHYNLLMGLMPHTSPRGVFASDYYRRDFLKFNERLGAEGVDFKTFVPRLYLPVMLQNLGYRTHAMVSLPVLNPMTILNSGFDTYKLMEKHNDMAAMVAEMKFCEEQPSFLRGRFEGEQQGFHFTLEPNRKSRRGRKAIALLQPMLKDIVLNRILNLGNVVFRFIFHVRPPI